MASLLLMSPGVLTFHVETVRPASAAIQADFPEAELWPPRFSRRDRRCMGPERWAPLQPPSPRPRAPTFPPGRPGLRPGRTMPPSLVQTGGLDAHAPFCSVGSEGGEWPHRVGSGPRQEEIFPPNEEGGGSEFRRRRPAVPACPSGDQPSRQRALRRNDGGSASWNPVRPEPPRGLCLNKTLQSVPLGCVPGCWREPGGQRQCLARLEPRKLWEEMLPSHVPPPPPASGTSGCFIEGRADRNLPET